VLLACGLAAPGPLTAEPDPAPADDLFDLPLEALVELPVTTVTGSASRWFGTPAAIYVIRGDEVRRSGLRALAEVLRMAPGVNVGQIDSRQWGVGVRGFNGLFANKLQVLVDGRVVYNDLFGGVYWDVQNLILEDLDRIEVIRGPGATLWGANAMNGVINVITKRPQQTLGIYANGGGGTEQRAFGELRYGAPLGEQWTGRVWGKYDNVDNTVRWNGSHRADDWDLGKGGFRAEGDLGDDTALALSGEFYGSSDLGQGLNVVEDGVSTVQTGDMKVTGGYAQARLERGAAAPVGWSLQTYYDGEDRENITGFKQDRDTIDLDFRHHFRWLGSNDVVWGTAYRYRRTDTEASTDIALDPEDQSTHLFTAFVQDTIPIVPERVFVMFGSKIEHNSFTGFEVQPSVRAWWTPDDRQTLWAAISRPVRRPSLLDWSLDSQLAVVTPGGLVITPLVGNDDLDAERLWSYELGYRFRPIDSVTIDIAAFYNDYHSLIAADVATGTFRGDGTATFYGGEFLAIWRASSRWRLEGSYSLLKGRSHDTGVIPEDKAAPAHQAQIRSYFELCEDVELDTALYYVGKVPGFDLDSYFRLDVGLTWRPRPELEFAVWGQNLLEARHFENASIANTDAPSQIERGVYGRVTLRF
jgi:iron complex outermembrane receptor protein